MENLSFDEILSMQRALQAAHAHEWEPMEPQHGRSSLLWMVEEVGEMAAVIKKQGDEAIMRSPSVREAFVEELGDVLMYLGDLMLCYDISARELSEVYRRKHLRNMTRDYRGEYDRKQGERD